MKAYKSMPHYVAVVLQIVCNNVDKYAAVIDNNCIRYTTATSKGKSHYLDSRKVAKIFEELQGKIGQHLVRSEADAKQIKQSKRGADALPKAGSIMAYRAKYQNS